MGCEYVCRCKNCTLQPSGKCGKTVTGVSLLTRLHEHICGDLAKCGDFFCKECFAVCRVNPSSHVCKPPGDAGTLTPEYLENIRRRVEARRESKRVKRRQEAQKKAEGSRKPSNAALQPTMAASTPVINEHMSATLSQLAEVAADVMLQQDDTQYTPVPTHVLGRRKRPVYEQVDVTAEEWLLVGDDGSIQNGIAGVTGPPVEVNAVPAVSIQALQLVTRDEPEGTYSYDAGLTPAADLDGLVNGGQSKPGAQPMLFCANILSTKVQSVLQYWEALGPSVPKKCCDDAMVIIKQLQQLEQQLLTTMEQQATAA